MAGPQLAAQPQTAPGPSDQPAVLAASAPLPVLRSLSGKPPPVARLLSSRSAFVEGLRELVRHDSVRELLVKELGPLIRERHGLDRGLSYAWRNAFFALLAVALASVLALLWASGLQRAAQPPAAGGRAPANATVDAEELGMRSRQIGLVAISTCGAIAGICLTRWSPAARMQVQQLLGRTAAHQALSAGVKGLAQRSPPLAGRAIGPLGQLLRLVRALLPSTAFEWLLVLFNLSLIAGVGSVWSFARSPAFKTVVDSIQLVISRTEFLRRLGAFGDASKLKLEQLALRFGNGNAHMQAMRIGPHHLSAGAAKTAAGAGARQWQAARRWWGQLGVHRRAAGIATSLPRSA